MSNSICKVATIHGLNVSALIDALQKSNLNETLTTGLVDTCTAIVNLLDAIANLPTSPPSLYKYMDLKGAHLSRHGLRFHPSDTCLSR